MNNAKTAIEIGQAFLDKAEEKGMVGLTTLHLIKLAYIAHGWMLGMFDRPLVKDKVHARRLGPVYPNLYDAVKHTNGNIIDERIADEVELNVFQDSMIDVIIEKYGNYTASYLSSITHTKGSPWDICQSKGVLIIPNSIIKEHYANLALPSDYEGH